MQKLTTAQYLVSPAKFHVKLRKIDCRWDSAAWEQPKRPLKQLVSVAVSGGGSGNRHPHFPSNPIFMQGFVPAGFPIQYSPFAKRTKIIFIFTQMTVSEELEFVRTCAMNPTKSNKIVNLHFFPNLSGPNIFYLLTKIVLTRQICNQNRQCFNLLVSGPGRSD